MELNKGIICSNSLYGAVLAASCVAQIAGAEESELGVKMPKLIFQVFNNFSQFCISVISRSDVKKSGFVLGLGAGMCTQSGMVADKHELVLCGTVRLKCHFKVVLLIQTSWGNAACISWSFSAWEGFGEGWGVEQRRDIS